MANQRAYRSPDPASEAMQQALEAEERAREAIEGCEAQAEAIRERARADAEAIEDRADRRIEWVQNRCAQVLEDRLAEERSQADREPGAEAPWADEETLNQAGREVAEQLTRPESDRAAEKAGSA
ncbi:hypothetical protein [Thiohalorhabdus sp.]|uniref:hypothetical protein n=1 Tax=Thiohalorhabdus sp. TaxID=3094134 RepID=UPI002FC2ECE8